MKDDSNKGRLIFRPTESQLKRFNKIANCGSYRTQSEVLRRILDIGMDVLEKDKEEQGK
jgi:hypothetical protein